LMLKKSVKSRLLSTLTFWKVKMWCLFTIIDNF
jgi:hypothetical protein